LNIANLKGKNPSLHKNSYNEGKKTLEKITLYKIFDYI